MQIGNRVESLKFI